MICGEKMELNKSKFKNLLHYSISKCGSDSTVGKTVLYKLLYFIDFNYFEIYEKSLTNETYKRLPHGPAPTHFDLAISELEKEEKITVDSILLYADMINSDINLLKNPK